MRSRGHNNIRKRKVQKQKRAVTLLCLLFLCFLLLYGVLYFKVNKTPKDRICEGVAIGQVDVSGLTGKEALKRIEEKEAEYGKGTVTFQVKEKQAEASLEELGFAIQNEEKLIEDAVEYGKNGGVFSRYFEIRKLKKEKKVFEPEYVVDEEKVGKILKERVGVLFQGASDASVTRTGGEFVITEEKDGLELDEKATITKLQTFLNEKWDGKAATVKAVEKVQKPKVTKEQLAVIQDNLGSFSTYCGSGSSRVTNIKVGTERINGTILMPGEEFSAGTAMRPFEKKTGYVEAGAYENGEVVKDIAGGICQVSTTLYNAVINAELEITSRQPHSMIVNYVKPSRDAAIAGDYKDLKFKNNTKYPVYIEGYVDNGEVHFNIYGKETRPTGRKIEFVSEILSTEPIVKKYVTDPELELGKIEKPSGGHEGIKAQLWKVVYENGKETSREVFNKSTYKPSTNKIKVGIGSGDAVTVQKIKDAVKTQDEAKIMAAIEEVKGQKH